MNLNLLNKLFSYNPKTGALRWRISPRNGVAIGDSAGTQMPKGHIQKIEELEAKHDIAHANDPKQWARLQRLDAALADTQEALNDVMEAATMVHSNFDEFIEEVLPQHRATIKAAKPDIKTR